MSNFKVVILTLFLFVFFNTELFSQTSTNFTIKEINDIPYYQNNNSDSNLTKLNLIIPDNVENPPVFIWIGGGAWSYVNRNQEMDLCRKFAKKGIAMVSVGHRLSPALIWPPIRKEGIKHPEHIKDIAKAFKWVYENAEKYGYDNSKIFIGGFSSGAHLATLLAADTSYLAELGLSKDLITAVIPVGGGYDIPDYAKAMFEEDSTLIENHINPVFGETYEEQWDSSPMKFIDYYDTPTLLISESYTYPFVVIFEKALREKGNKNFIALNFHNEDHASLWKSLSYKEDCYYRSFIVDYIKSF